MPNAAQVRKGFAEYVNRVAYGNERVLIERRGRPIVALIDMTDYQILLDHEARQDQADAAEARDILAHPERHRWQTLDTTPVPPSAPARRGKKAATADALVAEIAAVHDEMAALQRAHGSTVRVSGSGRVHRRAGKAAKARRR
jgi:prevent-host-death family protein